MSSTGESLVEAPGSRVALAALAAGSLICSLITFVFAIPALAGTFLWVLSALAGAGLAVILVLRSDARSWSRRAGWVLIALALGMALLVSSV
jgi:hypothetical protein